jgi:ATP-dependent helicase HrpB
MSATLEAEPVVAYLDALRLRSEGRLHPVTIVSAQRLDDRPLAVRVHEALAQLYQDGLQGHTLVFLPGAAEIRQCLSSCAETAARHGLKLLPLHGSLSFEAQKQAVAYSAEPKVIFSTNVAESSVTIEGVTAVIDSGLGREAVHSAWSGLSGLRTLRISQARCRQRTGRAGRSAPGTCIRLYSEADFRARPVQDAPEIHRTDLAESLLNLHGLGIADPGSLRWFEAPPTAALEAAERLLGRLGALDRLGRITTRGRRMAALPLHPRLARLVVAGEDARIPELARLAAVLLETGELGARVGLGRRVDGPGHALESDLWVRLDAYREAERADFAPGACRAAGLDVALVLQAQRTFKALGGRRGGEESAAAETKLLLALLSAYPDRVAKAGGAGTFALVGGGGARLEAQSRVRNAELILALEAEEVVKGTGREVLIRMASRIDPEWLLEAFPEAIHDTEAMVFNASSGRVELRSGLLYEDLCLDETRRGADPMDPRTAACLARAALDAGFTHETMDRLLERVRFLAQQRPELGIPAREDLLPILMEKACAGCANLKALAGQDWGWALRETLGAETTRLLEAWAPEIVLLKKRRVKVNYGGDAPWLEARLQDFLGLKEGPRIAGGTLPLVLHLLAPNHRAVQVTTDLAGFWQRTYKELRPQLSRRYPKHLWPENPVA